MTLWLVLRMTNPVEVMGVFSDHQLAEHACTHPWDCIGPLELDVKCPNRAEPWPGAYYPAFEKDE